MEVTGVVTRKSLPNMVISTQITKGLSANSLASAVWTRQNWGSYMAQFFASPRADPFRADLSISITKIILIDIARIRRQEPSVVLFWPIRLRHLRDSRLLPVNGS